MPPSPPGLQAWHLSSDEDHTPNAIAALGADAEVLKSGYLMKQGAGKSLLGRKSWKQRFFVLSRQGLHYFEDEEANALKGELLWADLSNGGGGGGGFGGGGGEMGVDDQLCFSVATTKRELIMKVGRCRCARLVVHAFFALRFNGHTCSAQLLLFARLMSSPDLSPKGGDGKCVQGVEQGHPERGFACRLLRAPPGAAAATLEYA